jgi:hypothetical protein
MFAYSQEWGSHGFRKTTSTQSWPIYEMHTPAVEFYNLKAACSHRDSRTDKHYPCLHSNLTKADLHSNHKESTAQSSRCALFSDIFTILRWYLCDTRPHNPEVPVWYTCDTLALILQSGEDHSVVNLSRLFVNTFVDDSEMAESIAGVLRCIALHWIAVFLLLNCYGGAYITAIVRLMGAAMTWVKKVRVWERRGGLHHDAAKGSHGRVASRAAAFSSLRY